MLEERIIDLVQRDVDGALDPGEEVELRLRLERDQEAKRYHDAMLDVTATLNAIPPDDPPADFTATVMESIQATLPRHPATTNVHPFSARRHDRFLAVRVGIGLAAAIAVAVVIAPSLFRALDSEHLGGTMVAPAATRSWTVDAGLQTRVMLATNERRISVRFVAPPGTRREVVLAYDPADARLVDSAGAASVTPDGTVILTVTDNSPPLQFERTSGKAFAFTVSLSDDANESSTTSIPIPAIANF